ncbi:recombination protein RecR [Candidatus Berkelbacteria bacterium]|nr:recombination protein RecR [Candidatus Berkelbacteria bacterium]
MSIIPEPVQNLIDEFSKLPGIGEKTAARLTFYLLAKADSQNKILGQAVLSLKENLKECQNCFNLSLESFCEICQDQKRESNLLMIVEKPLDIVALEKTGFQGQYFVLGGLLNPLLDIGPEDIRTKELLDRILAPTENVSEVILGLDPSLEGEATALFLEKKIKDDSRFFKHKMKISRLARGLPVGGSLEYTDEITLTRALENRI